MYANIDVANETSMFDILLIEEICFNFIPAQLCSFPPQERNTVDQHVAAAN